MMFDSSSNTVLRFDDAILVSIHLHGTLGFQSPLIQLRRKGAHGIFDQFARHVDDVWDAATPLSLALADGRS